MMNTMNPSPWAPIGQQQQNLLPAQPNHPFYLKWHPSNWDFVYFDIPVESGKGKDKEVVTMRKGFFIPTIRMERIVPGVNGVHQINGELGNPSSRIGQLQQQGWIYLDPQRYDYMHVYQVRGGRYHVLKWTNIRVVAGKKIEKVDLLSYQKWAVSLMVSGILNPVEPHFWELETLNLVKTPEKMQSQQHIPEIKKKMDEYYAILKDMKSFISEFEKVGLDIYKDIK